MLNDEHMGKRVSRAAAEKVTLQGTAQNLFMDEQQQQQQQQQLLRPCCTETLQVMMTTTQSAHGPRLRPLIHGASSCAAHRQ